MVVSCSSRGRLCTMSTHSDLEQDLALRRYDTVLKYLATETQIYWTRSQLFLVANAALLGFGLNNVPVSPDVRWGKLIALLLEAGVGIYLCILWRRGLRSGRGWMEHWKSALRFWEEPAFGDVNLYRSRPASVPESTSGVAQDAAGLFLVVWSVIAGYLAVCLLSKAFGCRLP